MEAEEGGVEWGVTEGAEASEAATTAIRTAEAAEALAGGVTARWGVEWGVLACLEGAVGAHQAAGEVMGVTGARSGAAVPTRGEEEDISRVVKA